MKRYLFILVAVGAVCFLATEAQAQCGHHGGYSNHGSYGHSYGHGNGHSAFSISVGSGGYNSPRYGYSYNSGGYHQPAYHHNYGGHYSAPVYSRGCGGYGHGGYHGGHHGGGGLFIGW